MNKIVKNTLILTLITVIAGFLLELYMRSQKIRLPSLRKRQRKKHGRRYFQM